MDLSTLFDPAGPVASQSVELAENEHGQKLDWLQLTAELVAGNHTHLGDHAEEMSRRRSLDAARQESVVRPVCALRFSMTLLFGLKSG